MLEYAYCSDIQLVWLARSCIIFSLFYPALSYHTAASCFFLSHTHVSIVYTKEAIHQKDSRYHHRIVSLILLFFEYTMAAFKNKPSTEVNEIYTNPESDSDSDFYDDCDKEESDDEDDYSFTYFTPRIFEFTSQGSINSEILNSGGESPLDFFEVLFDRSVLEQIVNETNKYKSLSNTSVPKIYSFLATVMLIAHTKKNRIKDYWSTDQLIFTPMFAQIFFRDRFLSILKFLHFNDNQQQHSGDQLHKIKPILDSLRKKFKLCIKPYKNLCIDESMMVWKGRLNFKQYIPSKRHRFRVKLFVLCDCHSGFVLDFIIYTGQQIEVQLDSNWYSNPAPFEKLHYSRTGACGAVRSNRIGLPTFPSKLRQGEQTFQHTNILLALKWRDKRDVHMLSTIHIPNMVLTT